MTSWEFSIIHSSVVILLSSQNTAPIEVLRHFDNRRPSIVPDFIQIENYINFIKYNWQICLISECNCHFLGLHVIDVFDSRDRVINFSPKECQPRRS